MAEDTKKELADLERQMAEHYAALADLGRQRRQLIAELRATMSAADVAAYLGISRARVYEILKER